MTQLDLDLKATVIPFPAARRRHLVEQVARTILRESDADALRYWRGIVDDISFPLFAAGVPRPIVEHQVRQFHDAVQEVMWRTGDRSGGAG